MRETLTMICQRVTSISLLVLLVSIVALALRSGILGRCV